MRPTPIRPPRPCLPIDAAIDEWIIPSLARLFLERRTGRLRLRNAETAPHEQVASSAIEIEVNEKPTTGPLSSGNPTVEGS